MLDQTYIDSILDILEQCNVPTFLDLALYGTYDKGIINAKRKNICGIFSGIGKGFGVWHLRSSVYFSRSFEDIRIFGEEANAACFNTLTTEITNRLLNNFSCTYFPLKYKTEQLEVCKFYDLLPSDCIHLAISETRQSQQRLLSIMKDNFYKRPHTDIYRVGIGDLMSFLIYKKQNRELPFYLKNDYEYIDSLDYYDWNCSV